MEGRREGGSSDSPKISRAGREREGSCIEKENRDKG